MKNYFLLHCRHIQLHRLSKYRLQLFPKFRPFNLFCSCGDCVSCLCRQYTGTYRLIKSIGDVPSRNSTIHIINWHFRRHHQEISSSVEKPKSILSVVLNKTIKTNQQQNGKICKNIKIKEKWNNNKKCWPTRDCHHFQDLVRTWVREVKLWK